MNLKLTFPVRGTITQGFGGNANTFYHSGGLMGHPGVDIVSFYDDIITDAVVGFNKKYIYSIRNRDNPDLGKFRAIYQIVEADDGVFEVSYGHCNRITCNLGYTEAGSPLATEGNTGDVYVGGIAISVEERKNGSKAGTHVHFQLRLLSKTKQATLHSLTTDGEYDFVDIEGYHFDIQNYNNGFNGCIDPVPYINSYKYIFNRDMDVGSFGIDVLELQKRLIKEGFANFTPISIYGPKTKLAVIAYQKAHGIDPIGRVGPTTRKSLNS